MKGLAYKKVTWLSSVKRISYSQMSPIDAPDTVTENVVLLDGRPKRRCRLYGPDSAWSWLVAFANFFVNFLIVGLGRMSGILYVDFMHIFHVDRKAASVPFAVQQAARNLFGPVAGILGQKYGLRFVTVIGGMVASLSALLVYFRTDMTWITVLWGVFFGLSTALTTTLNQVSIDQYFERNRATAGGFAFSGGCVGAFFFPILLETLISHYGMRGTFLVLGAILLHTIPAAMMLVEPPWKQTPVATTYTQNITRYGAFGGDGERGRKVAAVSQDEKTKFRVFQPPKLPSYDIDFAILQENSDIVFRMLTMEVSEESIRSRIDQNDSKMVDEMRLLNEMECVYSAIADPKQNSENSPSDQKLLESGKKTESQAAENGNASMANPDDEDNLPTKSYDEIPRRIYIRHKLQELYQMRGTRIIARFHYSDQSRAVRVLIELRKLFEKLSEEADLAPPYRSAQNYDPPVREEPEEMPFKVLDSNKRSNNFCSLIKTALKLHGSPLFLLICVCRGVFMLTFIPVVTVIVDFVMDQGLENSDGKYAIAALSLGDFLGRLCLGWINDCGCLTLPRYMLFGMILLGGSTAALPLLHSRAALFSMILVFGMLQGSLFVRHPMLISQYMKSHEQSIGMGFINFLSGFLGFALPPFIGFFRDTLGSYNHMFYINGIVCVVVGLLWGMEPLFFRPKASRSSKAGLRS